MNKLAKRGAPLVLIGTAAICGNYHRIKMKTKEVILKLHLRSTSYEKIYFSFANYYIWLKCDFFNMVFGAHLFCCFLFFVFFWVMSKYVSLRSQYRVVKSGTISA